MGILSAIKPQGKLLAFKLKRQASDFCCDADMAAVASYVPARSLPHINQERPLQRVDVQCSSGH